tara:strand:- start:3098 stop:3481 length:384 start_codon:yes stop_codon:yes gene_type:complete
MTITTNKVNSYAGIVEYSWTGEAGDHVAQEIKAVGAHFQIVQIAFNLVGEGSASVEFTMKTDHSLDISGNGDMDTELYAQNTSGLGGILNRWNNNAGPYIPSGSSADFAWTNTDSLAWGLSVMVRSE